MKPVYPRIIILFLLTFICGSASWATHYLGGEMTYAYLGNNNYRVTLRIYRDCGTGDPKSIEQDLPAFFSVFSADGSRMLTDTFDAALQYPLLAAPLSGCFRDVTAYCAGYAEMQKIISLPPSPTGYIIVNQRCCLITSVANIVDGGLEGLTVSCSIPANAAQAGNINSSPVFKILPPVRICQNTASEIDFGATDADGDLLSYRLTTGYRGGTASNAKPVPTSISFSPLPYAGGYSAVQPFGEYGELSIDAATGRLAVRCELKGTFLLNVACDEYRDGVLLGTVNRSFIITVSNCGKEVEALVQKDSVLIQSGVPDIIIARCAGTRTITFGNRSTGAVAYHWDFGVSGRDDDTSSLANPQFTYPVAGRYPLMLVAYGAGCNDTFRSFVLLSDDVVTPDFSERGGICMLDTLVLTDNSISTSNAIRQHIWKMSGMQYAGNPVAIYLSQSGPQSIIHIIVTNDGCIASITKMHTARQGDIHVSNDTTVALSTELFIRASGGSTYTWQSILPASFLNYVPGSAVQQVFTGQKGKDLIFTVSGKDAQGCGGTDTVRVTVSEHGYIFVPTAFTPNGDGRNDFLKVRLAGYNLRSFSIFNRQGNRVFESNSLLMPWDGHYKGQEAPSGTYFWMIQVIDETGKDHVAKGDVALLR